MIEHTAAEEDESSDVLHVEDGCPLVEQHGDQMASPSAVVFLLPTAAGPGPSRRPPARILGGEVLSIAADTRCDARSRS